MSSLYYANALFSKYQVARTSAFSTGVFPEQTSCAFSCSSQRASGYGSASTGAPVSSTSSVSLSSMYTNGANLPSQTQGMYPTAYELGAVSLNMHSSLFDHPSLPMVSAGDLCKAQSSGKEEQRGYHQNNENNLRIYPWMRSTGLWNRMFLKHRGVRLYVWEGGRQLKGSDRIISKSVLFLRSLLWLISRHNSRHPST